MGAVRLISLFIGLAVVPACHSANRAALPADKDPYLIRAEELEKSTRSNLYDAVFELRPRWFTRTTRPTAGEPLVYLDDQVLGTTGALRRFLPDQLEEVRYLSPTEAQVQYGQRNYGRAAIVLVLARN